MIALKKKKIVRNLIFIISFMALILIIFLIINIRKYNNNEDIIRLKEMNSDSFSKVLMVPYNIDKLYSHYGGDVSLATIEKSMYSFTHDIVPQYKEIFSKQYKNEVENYYEQNKFAIGVDTGISEIDEFESLIEGIMQLEGSLTIQTYELSSAIPSKTSRYLVSRLFVKYKNNKRIIFKVKISNEKLKNISSIKYNFYSIEN